MSLSTLALFFFINPAFAKDLPAGSLLLTQVGAVADLSGCESHVLANPWTATNTVKTVIGQAEAQRICAEAKGNLAIAEAKAQAIRDGAASEAGLVNAAAIPVMNGDSVSYDRVIEPDGTVRTHLATGPSGTVHELAAVAAALPQPIGFGNQYGYGAYDANPSVVGLARLSGIPLGTPMPFATGASSTTAACGTADECQKKVAALQIALATK